MHHAYHPQAHASNHWGKRGGQERTTSFYLCVFACCPASGSACQHPSPSLAMRLTGTSCAFQKVGVDGLAFQDIWSLDDEMLAMQNLPQPTAAIIFIFPGGEHEDQSSAPPLPPGSPFFLYQIAGLGNACGTIAAIHAVANSGAAASLAEGTTLKTFLDANA